MQALIEHPDQLERLRDDPSLLEGGIEEILRWSSPLIHFARTASTATVLGGAQIKEGDPLALFYPSANRDAAVFDEPFRFDVTRTPNPHLAFGIGEHFCVGAHLARLELTAAFKHLLPRLEHVELAGPVLRLRSSFVGGIKRLPIHIQLDSR
jgi:cholest-4-en-3-one 26-monooxygenase